MLYGVRGLGDNFVASEPGTISVDRDKGRIRFNPHKEGNGYWLRLAKSGELVAREIEDPMVHTRAPRPSEAKSP